VLGGIDPEESSSGVEGAKKKERLQEGRDCVDFDDFWKLFVAFVAFDLQGSDPTVFWGRFHQKSTREKIFLQASGL